MLRPPHLTPVREYDFRETIHHTVIRPWRDMMPFFIYEWVMPTVKDVVSRKSGQLGLVSRSIRR